MRKRKALLALVAALALLPLTTAGAVVNGTAARSGQFPFMASLQDGSGFSFCGGTVIRSTWVLTAGHCVQDGDASDLYVVTGKTDLGAPGGQRIKVRAVYLHPRFAPDLSYDVALLRLSTPTRSPAIRLASAADDDLERPGTKVTVAGWGDILPTLGLFAPNQMRYTDLKVVSDAECGQTNFGFNPRTGVCAAELLKDSCYGDSGGPLFGTKAGRRVQIGIVSYGEACALPKFPGVYSEVNNTDIRSWIRSLSGV